MKGKFLHTPQYFQFYLQDLANYERNFSLSDEDLKRRYCYAEGVVTILVLSEFSEIPIELEYLNTPPPLNSKGWDRIVECPLHSKSGSIGLVGCVEIPKNDWFGKIEAPPGDYVVRIHYGGQDSMQADGSSKDFYLLQVWPGSTSSSEVVFEVNRDN
ncbi:MAG: hypothetical protein ACSHWU_07375 [Marinicella sp.]